MSKKMIKICPICNGTGEVTMCDGTLSYKTYCIACNRTGFKELTERIKDE